MTNLASLSLIANSTYNRIWNIH